MSGSESYDEIMIGENEFLTLDYTSTSITPLYHIGKDECCYLTDSIYDYIKEKTFKNITISSLKDNYVIISKSSNPTIHFVIEHPKLIEAIENFSPIVKD